MFKTLKVFLIGLAMGTADIIPGVSGGTIAFISGIYDKLIESIAHINKYFLRLILKTKRKKARHYIHGEFLLKLFSGIFIAIISIAKLMDFLLKNHTLFVFSFFFGLVLASIILIRKQHKKPFNIKTLGAITSGIIAGYLLTSGTFVVSSSIGLLSIFFAGVFASIAMILPGISGSYILLLLGKYRYILNLITTQIDTAQAIFYSGNFSSLFNQNSAQILIFVGGVIFGLLGFSKILHWLLKKYKNTTIAILIGFMIGAIHTVFPRVNTETFSSRQGIGSIFLSLLGLIIIFLIQKLTNKNHK